MRSPLWRSAPRCHRCKASDLQLGWEGVLSGPAGEPSNARRPRGPRRKEVRLQRRVSPQFRVADLCPVLRSPQAQGRAVTARGGRRAKCRPLDTSSGGRGSEGRVRRASYRESPGGASLRRGPVRLSRPQLVFLPQASGPCLLSPRCIRGEHFSFSPGVGPPPPLALRTCSSVAREGSGAPPAPPPSSRRPSPRRARLLGGHPGSWPDHALRREILTAGSLLYDTSLDNKLGIMGT
ncbi:hypothetical protein NDU88_005991 [Pleurodeles waltl]|uniref:Uncharacterized protein n=1 Tax=Pleurodeles waltl TaxID=8319 RepID=A0AAV7MXW6_PLEWA|nr:hypothetical protein NDU88_005991 [Pleurodeles waltl]